MTGHINVMLVLQSCTDSLQVLPGSASETFPTPSDGTCNVSNVKFEGEVNVKTEEEECIATKDEDFIYIEEDEDIDATENKNTDIKEEVSCVY